MAKILDCKLVAEAIINDCKAEAANLKEKGISPKLAILRVGENGPDLSYEKGIFAITNTIGIDVEIHAFRSLFVIHYLMLTHDSNRFLTLQSKMKSSYVHFPLRIPPLCRHDLTVLLLLYHLLDKY